MITYQLHDWCTVDGDVMSLQRFVLDISRFNWRIFLHYKDTQSNGCGLL